MNTLSSVSKKSGAKQLYLPPQPWSFVLVSRILDFIVFDIGARIVAGSWPTA